MNFIILILIIPVVICFNEYLEHIRSERTKNRNHVEYMAISGYEQSVKDGKIIWVKTNGSSKVS